MFARPFSELSLTPLVLPRASDKTDDKLRMISNLPREYRELPSRTDCMVSCLRPACRTTPSHFNSDTKMSYYHPSFPNLEVGVAASRLSCFLPSCLPCGVFKRGDGRSDDQYSLPLWPWHVRSLRLATPTRLPLRCRMYTTTRCYSRSSINPALIEFAYPSHG